MKNPIYTGIGSRETPDDVLSRMEKIGYTLAKRGWVLRSGGADGADHAFEVGCDRGSGKKEIYLPWEGFNFNLSPLFNIPHLAYRYASEIHPVWDRLSDGAMKLHARNIQQVLGNGLDERSHLVICWTKRGMIVGGTATALRLAYDLAVVVVNLAIDKQTLGKTVLAIENFHGRKSNAKDILI